MSDTQTTPQLSAVPANLMPVQPGLKPVLPPVAQRYTEDQLKDKIEKHFGIVTSICNELDCTFSQFYRAVKHYKRPAPTTTLVKGARHDYIQKEFTHLPQRLKFKFWKNVYGWHFQRK